MNYYRLFALLLALIMVFSMISCKNDDPQGDDQHDQQTDETTVTYIFSVLTKTLHLPSCASIDRTNDTYNFEYNGSITAMLESGYSLCTDCLDPNAKGEESENGNTVQGGEGTVTYIYSVVSKTLHLPECYHVERMNDDYKIEHKGSIVSLLEKGYTICKDCLVPDTEEDEEEPEVEDYYSVPEDQATYAYNKTSRVVHELDCHNIDSMNEKNLRFTNLTLEELLELEHIPCGSCMPDEYEEYQNNHPEK